MGKAQGLPNDVLERSAPVDSSESHGKEGRRDGQLPCILDKGRFIDVLPDSETRIAKALSDAETAKRRATLALNAAKEALRLSLSTPRIGAMLKEIDEELQGG